MDNDFATGYALGADGRDSNADGMWGGQWVWAFLIIALLFRGGLFGGNGYGDANGALTRSDLCEGFNFNNLENAVRGVQSGLCDGFYAMNTSLLNASAALTTPCAAWVTTWAIRSSRPGLRTSSAAARPSASLSAASAM